MKCNKKKPVLFSRIRGVSAACTAGLIVNCLGAPDLHAHGIVGDRFFPATIATDDPFAVDELMLPSVSYFKSPACDDSPAVAATDIGFEFTKEIFPKFAVGIAGDYLFQHPDGGPNTHGFDNLSLSAKYQCWQNDKHEAIISIGGEWEIGGTGSKNVGADSTSTFTPAIFFGKGFGDLPQSLKYGRPFAVTGTVGQSFPTSADPNTLEWGFALEYSLPYLQSEVKDIGLLEPFRNMIPLVEFSFEMPENRGGGGTTGTINPGVLYESRYFQIGAEAIIPINGRTGHDVGAVVAVQLFIDSIFPKVFGHPIFGK